MKLQDTVASMTSSDYKERFQAEYYQTTIRYAGLDRLLTDYHNGTLPFTPTCRISLLEDQLKTMKHLLEILKERAEIEGVDITVDPA